MGIKNVKAKKLASKCLCIWSSEIVCHTLVLACLYILFDVHVCEKCLNLVEGEKKKKKKKTVFKQELS